MNELFKESLDLMIETSTLFSQIQPIDEYMEIFESDDPNLQLKEQQNESVLKKIADKIVAVAKKLVQIVTNIVDTIKDKFDEKKMDAEEKALYEQFKEAIKNDPELKNKKVRVVDFQKAQAEYNAILKDVYEAEKKIAQDSDEDFTRLHKRIVDYASILPKAAVSTVSVEAALRYAKSNRLFAKLMNASLSATKSDQDKLISALGGTKNYKKFEKDMKKWSKKQTIRRGLLSLQGKTCSSLSQAYSDTIRDIKRVISGKDVAGGLKDSRRMVKSLANNKEVAGVVSDALHVAKDIKSARDDMESEADKRKKDKEKAIAKAAKAKERKEKRDAKIAKKMDK